jgi:hypothetical protein
MSHVDVCLPPYGLHVLANCTHCKIALAETNIRLHRHTPTVYQTIAAAFHITHEPCPSSTKQHSTPLSPHNSYALCSQELKLHSKNWSDRLVIPSQAISNWFTTTAMAGNDTKQKCARARHRNPTQSFRRAHTAASPACLHCRERNE